MRQKEFQLGSVTHQHLLAHGNATAAMDLFVNSPGGSRMGAKLTEKTRNIRKSATPVPREKAKGKVPKDVKTMGR